jgi:hypothetical protein
MGVLEPADCLKVLTRSTFESYSPTQLQLTPLADGMSARGPSRHFAATRQFSRFRSEADIQRNALTNRIYEWHCAREGGGRKQMLGQNGPRTQSVRPIQMPDLRDQRVLAGIRRQGALLARHPENDPIDAWIEAVYDSSEWK